MCLGYIYHRKSSLLFRSSQEKKDALKRTLVIDIVSGIFLILIIGGFVRKCLWMVQTKIGIDVRNISMFKLNVHIASFWKWFLTGEQYVIESDGLLIKEVTKKNAGTYTCRARVPQTGELEERDVRLDVGRKSIWAYI